MVGIEQKYCRSGKDECFFDRKVYSYLAYVSIIHMHASALLAESEVICTCTYNAITSISIKQKSDSKIQAFSEGCLLCIAYMLHPAVYQYMITGKYICL